MRYSLILLLFVAVACQQPASTNLFEYDLSANRGASSVIDDASGVVTWTNKPGNAGKITGANGLVYQYNVNAGHTVNGFRPKVGDAVLFQAGPGAVARLVRLGLPPVDDDDDDDNGDDDGDDDGSDDPVCLPGQFLAGDGNCYWIPS